MKSGLSDLAYAFSAGVVGLAANNVGNTGQKYLTVVVDHHSGRLVWAAFGRDVTDRQQAKLAFIQKLNAPIYRAYLLKEQLRAIYHAANTQDALALLDAWLKWGRRCRLEPFVKLARRITEQRHRVEAALRHSLSNARVEQVNTQIRLIVRRGFGYRSPEAVIALAMLSLGGLCPSLPGR